MSNSNCIYTLLFTALLVGCSGKYGNIPFEKVYWTPQDYDDVVFELRFPDNKDDKLPTFDNPETRLILEKLTDPKNYQVVLDDDELGLRYRNDVAENFFHKWKNMNKIYWAMDRKDQYIYDIELIECYKFGLGLQRSYFQLGNEAIIESAIDPNSPDAKRRVNSNVGILVNNYHNYLDIIKNEKAISAEGLRRFSEGLDEHFSALVEQYPTADFKDTRRQMELLLNKSKSEEIKKSLTNLIDKIDATS